MVRSRPNWLTRWKWDGCFISHGLKPSIYQADGVLWLTQSPLAPSCMMPRFLSLVIRLVPTQVKTLVIHQRRRTIFLLPNITYSYYSHIFSPPLISAFSNHRFHSVQPPCSKPDIKQTRGSECQSMTHATNRTTIPVYNLLILGSGDR